MKENSSLVTSKRVADNVLWATFLLGMSFWLGDVFLEYLWFNPNETSFFALFVNLEEPHELMMRMMFVAVVFIGGFSVSRVISHLILSESIARKQEKNIRTTLNSIGDAVIAADTKGKIVDMNPVAEKLTGFSSDEAKDKALIEVFNIVNAQTKEPVTNPVEQVLKSGQIVGLANHTVLIAKDKTNYQIADSAAPIKDDEGNIIGVVLVFRDVTEEYLVREDQRHLAMVTEQAAEGIAVANLDGKILYINQAWLLMHGYDNKDNLIGKSLDIFHSEKQLHAEVIPFNERTFKHGHELGEVGHMRKDGTTFPTMMTTTLLKNEHGEPYSIVGFAEDITERKQAENELARNEAKFRAIYNQALHLSSILNIDGTILDVNETARKFFDVSDSEIIGKVSWDTPWWSKHPEAQKKFKNAIKRAGLGEYVQFETTHQDSTGKTHYIDFSVKPVKDNNGNIFCLIPEGRNITEQREAETELARNEAKFRAIYNQALHLSGILDLDGKLIDINEIARKFVDVSESELLGKLFWETPWWVHSPEAQNQLKDAIGKAAVGKTIQFETTHFDSNGKMHHIDFTVKPVTDDKGNVFCLIPEGRDITERKEAENELHHLRNYLSNIIDSMPSVLVGVDNDGNITQWNNEATKSTGVSSEKAIGQSLVQTFPRLGKEMERVQNAMKSRQTISAPVQTWQDGDNTRYEDITVYPLVANGIEGAVIRVDDVTNEHEREALLRHQQKLESIGTLAGGVAHEINNPINIIMNYGQLIIDDAEKGSQIAEDANEIVNESLRIAKIVKNLLSFSRQEEEHHSLAQISDIINSTLTLTNKILSKDQIEFIIEIDDNLPQLKCRSQQIMQVLMNLITNARDALNERYPAYDDNKIIKISSCLLEIDNKKWVRTEVEDHGLGIKSSIKDRIFDPFFTSKPRDKGTGLGLSVSYGIIKDHGGFMKVETTEGENTRFYFDLPLDSGWE